MPRPLILISANLAWNLVNFRSGLIRFLIEKGYDVVGVAPPDPVAEEQLAAIGCGFEPLNLDAKGLSPFADLWAFWQYRTLMQRHRPAAFLGYTVKPNVYGGMAAALCNVPHIANISGLGTAFIRENWLTQIVGTLYRFGLRRASTVFFQNEDDRTLFLEKKLVRPEQCYLVPGSGIDCVHFAPQATPNDKAKSFLMVARLLRDKGVLEYVEAARQLKLSQPDLQFRILGFLDVANRTAISRDEVEKWVSDGIIEYLPPVSDVRPFVAAADCVVLPSYREGTSRVLLEAAAMAKPIVATDVPGCREVVEDGVNGVLCAPQDAGGLAKAVAQICSLPVEKLTAMGSAGRKKIIAEFSQERVNAIYQQALERARAVS